VAGGAVSEVGFFPWQSSPTYHPVTGFGLREIVYYPADPGMRDTTSSIPVIGRWLVVRRYA
jgi:hypothetical protein